jgi:serine/threonine protein kinase
LITEKRKAKLADFGVSQLFEEDDDKISKTEGTYHFMAPECCDRKTHRLNTLADVECFSGKAADVWALGVTLYCMIYNKLPFWDESEYGIIQKIHSEE